MLLPPPGHSFIPLLFLFLVAATAIIGSFTTPLSLSGYVDQEEFTKLCKVSSEYMTVCLDKIDELSLSAEIADEIADAQAYDPRILPGEITQGFKAVGVINGKMDLPHFKKAKSSPFFVDPSQQLTNDSHLPAVVSHDF